MISHKRSVCEDATFISYINTFTKIRPRFLNELEAMWAMFE